MPPEVFAKATISHLQFLRRKCVVFATQIMPIFSFRCFQQLLVQSYKKGTAAG